MTLMKMFRKTVFFALHFLSDHLRILNVLGDKVATILFQHKLLMLAFSGFYFLTSLRLLVATAVPAPGPLGSPQIISLVPVFGYPK